MSSTLDRCMSKCRLQHQFSLCINYNNVINLHMNDYEIVLSMVCTLEHTVAVLKVIC